MFGGDRDARDRGDRAFYHIPEGDWSNVSPETLEQIRRLGALLGQYAASQSLGDLPESPSRLAYGLIEAANSLSSDIGGEDGDLRQVILTLRNALAVTWDCYSPLEAERTTVFDYMTRLREQIEDFERDLEAFDKGRTDSDRSGNSNEGH